MVQRRSGLGRGLGALLPADNAAVDHDDAAYLLDIPIGAIEPNPHQPRVAFDEESLQSLAASVRELGVLQPVLVRPLGSGRYQLIAGERRWRASKRAALDTIPAIVKVADDEGSVEQALVENLHRDDLNPLEEAAAYQQLVEEFELTHEQVATRVGRSRSAVTNTLRLLQLPQAIQKLLAENRLSAGHARALLGTPDRAFQETLARQAVEEGWNVRAVEEAIRARAALAEVVPSAAEASSTAAPRLRPPGLLELEELLSAYLDTRVSVSMAAKRGKVVVDFATLEDLERIYRRITEPSTDDGA